MSTDLVPVGTYDLSEVEETASIWREELGDDFVPEFPRIKVPAGGGTTWEIDEDTPPTRELNAVVVAHHKSSRLYLDPFEDSGDGNRRPDAWSLDGKVQVVPEETRAKIDAKNAAGANLPYPLTDLSQCPYNKFPSDGGVQLPGAGAGKSNREYRELYILVNGSDSAVPYQLSVPATSIKTWDRYAAALVMKGHRIAGVETVITLVKERSAGGFDHSKVEFRRGAKLDPSDAPKLLEFSRGIKDIVKRDPHTAPVAADAGDDAFEAAVVAPAPAPLPPAPAQAAPLPEPATQEAPAVHEPVADPAVPDPAPEPVAVAAAASDDDLIDF